MISTLLHSSLTLPTSLCTSFLVGDIGIIAGLTTSSSMKGGTVRISAGEGASDQLNDGGDGGDMILTAGEAKGADVDDNGGRVTLL